MAGEHESESAQIAALRTKVGNLEAQWESQERELTEARGAAAKWKHDYETMKARAEQYQAEKTAMLRALETAENALEGFKARRPTIAEALGLPETTSWIDVVKEVKGLVTTLSRLRFVSDRAARVLLAACAHNPPDYDDVGDLAEKAVALLKREQQAKRRAEELREAAEAINLVVSEFTLHKLRSGIPHALRYEGERHVVLHPDESIRSQARYEHALPDRIRRSLVVLDHVRAFVSTCAYDDQPFPRTFSTHVDRLRASIDGILTEVSRNRADVETNTELIALLAELEACTFPESYGTEENKTRVWSDKPAEVVTAPEGEPDSWIIGDLAGPDAYEDDHADEEEEFTVSPPVDKAAMKEKLRAQLGAIGGNAGERLRDTFTAANRGRKGPSIDKWKENVNRATELVMGVQNDAEAEDDGIDDERGRGPEEAARDGASEDGGDGESPPEPGLPGADAHS